MADELTLPEIGDYNWGEQLLAAMTALGQTGTSETIVLTSSVTEITTRATVLEIDTERSGFPQIKFETPMLRLVKNISGTIIKLGTVDFPSKGWMMLLPTANGYDAVGLQTTSQDTPDIVFKPYNGIEISLDADGAYNLGINFANLSETDVSRLRKRLEEC